MELKRKKVGYLVTTFYLENPFLCLSSSSIYKDESCEKLSGKVYSVHIICTLAVGFVIPSFLLSSKEKVKVTQDEVEVCIKCGRKLRHNGKLCYVCNKLWDKYMKEHPLKNYGSPEESMKRWDTFTRRTKDKLRKTTRYS